MGEQSVERRLAAIVAADVAGYSRLIGLDEAVTVRTLRAHRAAIDPLVARHGGRIVKTTGDGVLLEFPSVVAAVECAVAIQRLMAARNAGVAADRQMRFRIGVNLGDVLIEGDDILGDGVNIAARLEAIAEPGGICISGTAYEHVRDKIAVEFKDLGEPPLKNIARPVRVYGIDAEAVAALPASDLARAPPSRLGSLPRVWRIAAAGVAVTLIVAIGIWFAVRAFGPSPTATAARLSIVVLPFANLSGDPAQEYFADGITENLTTGISHIPGSFVIARNTAFTFKGKPIDVRAIGKDLGVRYALEGSVQRAGAQVQVNAQLIDAETGAHLWAERFDATAGNLLDLQNNVTDRLAREFGVQVVDAASRRSLEERPSSPDVEDLLLRATAVRNQLPGRKRNEDLRTLSQDILKLDPKSAIAWAYLAFADISDVGVLVSVDPSTQLHKGEQELEQAQSLTPNLPFLHLAKGLLYYTRSEPEESLAEMQAYSDLEPIVPFVKGFVGYLKIFVGRPEETEPLVEQAIRMSPHDPFMGLWFGYIGYSKNFLGEDEEAVTWLRRSISFDPNYGAAHLYLSAAYANAGRIEEARAQIAETARLLPGYTIARLKQDGRSSNPIYLKGRERIIEGLRKAGMPEE